MSEAYFGEIRIFAFGYAPSGWAKCDGQEIPIAQNQALFSLLGTTYGGNGTTTFCLPNLQGRMPIDISNSHSLGEAGGESNHTLTVAEMTVHKHSPIASSAAADQSSPNGNYWASNQSYTAYAAQVNEAMSADAVAPAGAGLAHPNMSPYLVFNFCICLYGIYPPRD